MTTKYLNFYRDIFNGGGLTTGAVHDTAEEAHRFARVDEPDKVYAIAVPVEIPDPPPHEWKVGDWFIPSDPFTWDTATRICDMTADGRWSGITRWQNDDPRGVDGWTVDGLARGATPCDPPEWWEGER